MSSYLRELDEVDAEEAKQAGPERLSATELKQKIAQLKQRQDELRTLAEEVQEKGRRGRAAAGQSPTDSVRKCPGTFRDAETRNTAALRGLRTRDRCAASTG
ncbi:MAG TPA: hypothetical protein VGI59_10980, partial [Candidatus Udaeobacter sp.]